eukprot:6984008-Ditylum_brightwellii.AAC.1
MACHSFVVAIAVLTENMRVVTVTVIVAGSSKSVHFMIVFFIAAAIDFQRMKLVKGRFVCFDATRICFCALNASIQLKTVLRVVGPIRPVHFTVGLHTCWGGSRCC